MNATNMEELMAQLRSRRRSEPPPSAKGRECLSFGRVRALTLDPDRWEANERRHVDGCRRCSHLVQQCAAQMPHLSLWTLLRRRAGTLPAREEQAVEYHLDAGACRVCRERDERLARALDRVVRFPAPFALPAPGAVSAATGALDLFSCSQNHDLETDLYEQGERITLEVRSKNDGLRHALIAYVLRGPEPDRQKEGFLVLHPDLEGWSSAEAVFDARELYWALEGHCDEVMVTPMCIHMLMSDQREALLASVSHALRDPISRSAWRTWIERVAERSESVNDEAWQIVCEARSLLMP